jgi:hemolysin activation/secretion protein
MQQNLPPRAKPRALRNAFAALCALFALLLATAQAAAQNATQNEAQHGTATPTPPRRSASMPQKSTAKPMQAEAKTAHITVLRIVLEGVSLVPEAELQALVANTIGQSLSLAEFEHIAQERMIEHYRQRGWSVQVYLPQQKVVGGIVHVQILENRYSNTGGTVRGEAAPDDTEHKRLVSCADCPRNFICGKHGKSVSSACTKTKQALR